MYNGLTILCWWLIGLAASHKSYEGGISVVIANKIGKYDIGELIGSGSFGSVFEATDSVLKRKVALKVLSAPASPHGEFKRHLREARALARLRHNNIVTLFEFSETDGHTLLAMEHVDGQPLTQRLLSGPLPVDEVLSLGHQLADALVLAHEEGIAHADLKPTNIILDGTGKPLLVDFGLANFLGPYAHQNTAASAGSMTERLHGTVAYMPPELFMGAKPDAKTDIFSFGAVLFEMLTGRRAFEGENQAVVMNRILNGKQEDLTALRPETPAPLQTLIKSMLSANRDLRPNSMVEVYDALATMSGNAPARPPVRSLRLWPRLRGLMKSVRPSVWASLPVLAMAMAIAWWSPVLVNGLREPSLTEMIEAGLADIMRYEEKGAIDSAVETFQRVLARDPENAAATAGLSLALFRRYTADESDEAIRNQATGAAELALKLDRHLALSNVAMAVANDFGGDATKAEDYYNRALTLDPSNFFAMLGLAELKKTSGEIEQAIALFEEAALAHPDHNEIYDALGLLHFELANYSAAEKSFLESVRIEPDNIWGYASLSAVQHMLGRSTEAISTIQKGLQVRPHPVLYNNLGTYLYFLGQYPQAADAFERMLELEGNSHNYLMWSNLGDAYRWTPGAQEKSMTAYRRAAQLLEERLSNQPDNVTDISRAALLYAKLGDTAKSASFLESAIDTPSPSVFFRAALAREISGNREEALAYLEQAIEAGYALTEIQNEPELAKLRQDRGYHFLLSTKGDQ